MKKFYFSFFFVLGVYSLIAQVDVTFSVDMTDTAPDANGIFMSGDWMSEAGLGDDWQEPGSNSGAELTDPDGDNVFTLTVSIPAGSYAYKFSNGNGWPNAEAGGGSDNYQADLSGCGGTDNGFGGYNRNVTVPAGNSFAVTTYLFNSCTESTILNTINLSSVASVMLQPNPASSQVEITLTGAINSDHTLRIYSFSGQLIEQINLGRNNRMTVDVSDYPAGMYMLNFQNDRGETGSKKLIVK